MSGPGSVPPDNRTVGSTGHIADHSAIADLLGGLNGGTVSGTGNTYLLPSGDTTGATDTPAINNALAASLAGQNVVLGNGVFWTNSPILIPPGGVLRGNFGMEQTEVSTIVSNHVWGTSIRAASSGWSTGAALPGGHVNAVVACIGQAAGGYTYNGYEYKVMNLMIDCEGLSQPLFPSIDGLQMFGGASRGRIYNVYINKPPHDAFSMINDSFGNGSGANHITRLNCKDAFNYGVYHFKNSDCTFIDCLMEACGNDGFNVTNASNGLYLGCRSEHNGKGSNGGNGFSFTCTTAGTGTGVPRFVACSTDRNNNHGFYITGTGSQAVPVILSGCQVRRDGVNGGSSGGNTAGINVTSYPGAVMIDGCGVFTGVGDDGSTPNGPQYGLRLHTNNNNTYIVAAASYFQGDSAGINDDGTAQSVRYGSSCLKASGSTSNPTVALL